MTAAAAAGPLIGPIIGVTICTPGLEASEAAYVQHLRYRVTRRGVISTAQAALWQRPAVAGARYVALSPAAADDFEFRLIESRPPAGGYRAFAHYGWNAAELIVQDVDALAAELADSPFQIIGPPQDLSFAEDIRAMQLRGPAGEIIYLTQFKRELPELPAPPARCAIDRVFIMIVTGPSLDGLLDFYSERFAIPRPQPMQSRVKVMSEVFGLSPEERYRIAAVPVRGRCYIEADQMPAAARPPDASPDALPPGIAIVSFRQQGGGEPRCITGAAGELIELEPAG